MANKTITIHSIISVKDLAEKLDVPVSRVIALLMKNSIMATVNENLDFETAAIIAEEFETTALRDELNAYTPLSQPEQTELTVRPPVVTIMGHVDHGKTTLLDTIRATNVVSGESGGITQHIAAYQVVMPAKSKHKGAKITFLDTPGHAAFTAMRQHGASITDIVVLVIAANDGIKAQTIEAIDHAKQAHVPIIVAATKTDLPDANLERIKQQLSELEMVPEDWGGQTIIVPVSAKSKRGIEDLLEMILLVADLAELKASSNGPAVGVVVESHIEVGKGPVATVLIQNGLLHIGESITVGKTFGKVRTLEDFRGQKLESARPSDPVIISGMKEVPNFGDSVIAVSSDKEAREHASRHLQMMSVGKVHSLSQSSGLDDAVSAESVEQHALPLIIKADVKGTLEAVHQVLDDVSSNEASVTITLEGVGAVSESDVTHAKATKSSILAFRVPVSPAIRNLASSEKVLISSYDVIYDLLEDAKKALSKLLPPEIVEVPQGQAKVIALFKGDKRTVVVGVQIEQGIISDKATFRLMRQKAVVGEGVILQIRRGKDHVKEVESGQQAGVSIPGGLDVAEGDVIEAYRTETRYRTL